MVDAGDFFGLGSSQVILKLQDYNKEGYWLMSSVFKNGIHTMSILARSLSVLMLLLVSTWDLTGRAEPLPSIKEYRLERYGIAFEGPAGWRLHVFSSGLMPKPDGLALVSPEKVVLQLRMEFPSEGKTFALKIEDSLRELTSLDGFHLIHREQSRIGRFPVVIVEGQATLHGIATQLWTAYFQTDPSAKRLATLSMSGPVTEGRVNGRIFKAALASVRGVSINTETVKVSAARVRSCQDTYCLYSAMPRHAILELPKGICAPLDGKPGKSDFDQDLGLLCRSVIARNQAARRTVLPCETKEGEFKPDFDPDVSDDPETLAWLGEIHRAYLGGKFGLPLELPNQNYISNGSTIYGSLIRDEQFREGTVDVQIGALFCIGQGKKRRLHIPFFYWAERSRKIVADGIPDSRFLSASSIPASDPQPR